MILSGKQAVEGFIVKILLQKLFSSLSIIALFVQVLFPLTQVTQIYAQEVTPTVTDTPTTAPTDTVTPTDASTPTPTATITPTTTQDNTAPTVTPTDTITPTDTTAPTPEDTSTPAPDNANSGTPTSNNTNTNNSQAPPTNAPTITPTTTPMPEDTTKNGKLTTSILSNIDASMLDISSNQTNSASLTTDKTDYSPTSTALITGTGLIGNKPYTLEITSSDSPAVDFTTTITTDSNGSFTYAYQLDGNYRPNYTVYVKDGEHIAATTTFTDGACDSGCLDQYDDLGNQWQNGNLSNSGYREGDSVPYRLIISGLSNGTHTVEIAWDTTDSGAHAIDYITTYNRTVTSADPCNNAGFTCSSPTSTFTIPTDSNVTGSGVNPVAGNLTLFGATITSVSPYTLSSSNKCSNNTGSYTGSSTTCITITFNTSNSNVVLSWGGHIGSQIDWGVGNSASAISGSSYHTRLIAVDGSGGNQDRSLAASAILPTPGLSTQISNSTIYIGSSVTDKAIYTEVTTGSGNNAKSYGAVSGTTTFYVCGPTGSATSCTSTSTLVGTSTNSNDSATSPSFTPTQTGVYCFAAYYTPDTSAQYSPIDDTVTTNECVTVSNPPTGTLTVYKVTDPSSDTTTQFSITATGSGTITGNPTQTITGGSSVKYTVTAGTYSVSEAALAGWTTTSNTCSNIQITASGSASCTITNTKQATLTVKKVLSPSADTGLFNLQIDNTTAGTGANVGNGGTTGAVVVTPGQHTVSETAGTNTDLSNYTASYSGACDTSGNVTISAGQNATCTITNTRNTADLKAVKVVDDGTDLTRWSFALDGGTPVAANSNGQVDFGQVTTNVDHTITESGPSGYHLVSVTGTNCSNNNDGSSATANIPNGTISTTCTFTNDRNTGSVVVHKALDTTGTGTFITDDTEASILGFTWTLSSYTAKSFGTTVNNVPTGSYTVTEDMNTQPYRFVGWYTTGSNTYSCTNPQGLSLPISVGVSYGSTTDITLCNQRETGTITLNKTWSGTAGEVNLNIGTTAGGSQVTTAVAGTTGGTTGAKTVTTGTYYLSETGANGTNLSNYSAVLSCYDNNGALSVTNNSVEVTNNENVVCTFTNTRNQGTIVITKTAYGVDGNQAFDFSILGASSSSQTITPTGSNGTYTGSTQNISVDTGIYSVTETNIPTGWTQTGVSCTDMTTNTPLSSNTSFTVSSGHTVECAFYDTEYSSISGLKFNDANGNNKKDSGETGIQGWKIDLTGTTSDSPGYTGTTVSETTATDASGDFSFTNLLPGEYTVCEETQSNWNQTYPDIAQSNYTCPNGTNGYAVLIDSTQAGQDFSGNTFGNQGFGTLVIHKLTDGTDGTFDYTISGPTPLSESVTTVGNSGTTGNLTVAAGNYNVSENTSSGWTLTNSTCSDGTTSFVPSNITVPVGTTVTCTFTNSRDTGTILVHKAIDATGSGTFVTDDATANKLGFSWSLDGSGTYDFGASVSGVKTLDTHTVNENLNNQAYHFVGWYDNSGKGSCINPDGTTLPLDFSLATSGTTKTITLCNQIDYGTIVVHKVTDPANDPTNFTITATGSGSVLSGSATQTDLSTTHDVTYRVTPGTYTVDESSQANWNETGNTCSNLSVAAGDTVDCTITNTENGTIIVHKMADTLGNGTFSTIDSDANTLGFRWGYDATTPANNINSFGASNSVSVTPGSYTIYENNITGYKFVGWIPGDVTDNPYYCGDVPNTTLPATLTVGAGQTAEVTLCNQFQNPILTLTKSNDKLGIDQNPGSSVLYTLTITATQAAAQNVVLTDLLPKGFTYRDGSATIDYGNGSGPQTFTNFADDYHSPGIWDIGTINKDQTITLTLIADISGSQNPGLYKDVAYAQGQSLAGNTVIATAATDTTTNPGYIQDPNFVGTQVNVVADQESGASVNVIQDVLGASTSVLPSTGANVLWIYLAILLVLLGVSTIVSGIMLKKKYV